MGTFRIEGVTLVPGDGRPVVHAATVVLDGDGVVSAVEEGPPGDGVLFPSAVDLHLDNLSDRRKPRATVLLNPAEVMVALDAECAASGIGVVCVAARCEEASWKGIFAKDAVAVARAVEELAPSLACDWRVHARVEVTDDEAVAALGHVLQTSSRVALISVMEHSGDRTRFASVEEHRRYYAEDWGVSLDEVDAVLAAKATGRSGVPDRRRAVAAAAAAAGITLASHDDRTPAMVEDAAALGATVAEFPLTLDAAVRAGELGLLRVLGAPNAVRGRSTAPGNVLVADAVTAGTCDVLCSDYLPSALGRAPFALAAAGVAPLARTVDLVAAAPAAALGLPVRRIEIGRPLDAALWSWRAGAHVGIALWRDGRLVWSRNPAAGWAPLAGNGR